ncbi:hypothetical protein AAMO2058_000252900, partial [Amorphochlora amoebiformis]
TTATERKKSITPNLLGFLYGHLPSHVAFISLIPKFQPNKENSFLNENSLHRRMGQPLSSGGPEGTVRLRANLVARQSIITREPWPKNKMEIVFVGGLHFYLLDSESFKELRQYLEIWGVGDERKSA